jgi:hypothetical protein
VVSSALLSAGGKKLPLTESREVNVAQTAKSAAIPSVRCVPRWRRAWDIFVIDI